ncbi:MAG TPA: hypothetical protein VFS05_15360 [Gemmatimonadaceae bacterium]|nr:hypothetical protein [Gemmatimonadaceae bacterium]
MPSFVTAGTRRTRVSEMRLSVRAGRLRLEREPAGPANASPIFAISARRSPGPRPFQPRWSG